jgi:hypothetical protein
MRGRFRKLRLAETPPHRAEIWFPFLPCRPLPARGARSAGCLQEMADFADPKYGDTVERGAALGQELRSKAG